MNRTNGTYRTDRINRTYILFIILAVLVGGAAVYKLVKAATNIDATNRWAWSDASGWWDFYTTNSVEVTSYKLTGYASSSIGDISLDCATTRNGNICGTSNYGICNGQNATHQSDGTCSGAQGNGVLSGYAWNDAIGWISFCGGNNTSQCPGSISYGVTIDSNGDFQGWAWNDIEGWISFNSANHGGANPYWVNTAWRAGKRVGYLESSIFDQQTQGILNSIVWQGTKPTIETCVKFQIAVSNNPNGPWNYSGPRTNPDIPEPNTYFGGACPAPDQAILITGIDRTWVNNQRYLRYKVKLESNFLQDQTPIINNIILNWSP